jgi:hypothetical protein
MKATDGTPTIVADVSHSGGMGKAKSSRPSGIMTTTDASNMLQGARLGKRPTERRGPSVRGDGDDSGSLLIESSFVDVIVFLFLFSFPLFCLSFGLAHALTN